jgi:long-chain acyl-CoA synthetase
MIARGGPRPAPGTLNQLFFDAVERYRKPDALQVKVAGRYEPISHATLAERVRRVALGLRSLGIVRGDRVAILSGNRPEWAITDLGCLTAQLTDVPIYPTLPAEQVAYILRDAGAVAIFVADAEQLAKVASVRGEIPALRTVVTFEAARDGGADLTLADLEERGRAAETPETIDRHRDEALAVQPHEVATLIYTSGTTGAPKGVMLTHDNIFSNVEAARQVLPFENNEVSLSLLPLSHIFERMAGHYLMLAVGASIAYAESIDTVAANLVEVRPTFLLSVPRL